MRAQPDGPPARSTQIKGLAAYYASQTPAPQGIEGDRARLQAGKSIFESGVAAAGVPACSSCHGAHGEGNASFPRIAGQHASYLVKQLIVFQRTDERPEGSVMKPVAHALSRQNIDDVATYLQALPGPVAGASATDAGGASSCASPAALNLFPIQAVSRLQQG